MGQIFPRSANIIARISILGAVLVIAGLLGYGFVYVRSARATGVGVVPQQPIPFYHNVHVAGVGIDCRYCHTSVEVSPSAGIPSTQVCMNCHSQILVGVPMMEPIHESFRSGIPIEWNRVHNLPDHVFFNHSIHVNKGVGCATCHGRVDQVTLIGKVESLQMTWCLECHNAPERFIRPREEVYNMAWEPPADQIALGRQLVIDYNVESKTDCYTCHR